MAESKERIAELTAREAFDRFYNDTETLIRFGNTEHIFKDQPPKVVIKRLGVFYAVDDVDRFYSFYEPYITNPNNTLYGFQRPEGTYA